MPQDILEPSQSTDFSPVARKKRRNKTYRPRPLLERLQRILDELCGHGEDAVWAEEVKGWYITHMLPLSARLFSIEIFQDNITAMRSRPARCNCLGIGSPEDSEAARVQLALLLHLGDKLEIVSNRLYLLLLPHTDGVS